ncbi:neuromedin-S isoform X8 [Mirounga leonina]|uniref:neuromedin-S isoform X8 n=1 Tax=Mirounga leonina TaxID=9715 RepID=UPI00156C2606|nr:neuromedin-S isoform X8 [Mirounga leonina]
MDKLLAQLSDMLLWAKENIHKDLELDSGCISRQRHHLFLVFEDLRLFSLNYSVGFPRPLADPPDGLDVMQLERLAYWATLSRQLKDNQDIYKRFLFHYSRTQKPTQPVKSGIPPVHPLMRLAAQLEDRRVKRFPQQRVGFGDCHSGFHQEVPSCHTIMDSSRMSTAQHPMANCQGTEETRTITPSRTVQEFSGKEKLDQIKKPSNYFEHMSTFFL